MVRYKKATSKKFHFSSLCSKKAQQEMVGFVLIVILVVVAMMVFLVIQVKKPEVEVKSARADNLLGSLMEYTTECVVYPPQYENIRDLIKSCHNNERCDNIDKNSCVYLNETVSKILADLTSVDSTITAYELFSTYKQDSNSDELLIPEIRVTGGSCNQSETTVLGGGPELISAIQGGTIRTYLKICSS